MHKITLEEGDNQDIREHLSNIKKISGDIVDMTKARSREIKSVKRIWENVWLRAKMDKKIPADLEVPEFLNDETLIINVGIEKGVASWKGKKVSKPTSRRKLPKKQSVGETSEDTSDNEKKEE